MMYDQTNESVYYNSEFWFDEIHKHGNVVAYDESYYAYKLYKKLIVQLTDLPDGYIVVLGTHNCLSFDILCSHFGSDRCIGYDISNPTSHSKVQIKNVLDLTANDKFPIAFVHNDIGNFSYTPMAKLHAQKWAANNVVKGGYFLGRNNLNKAKFPLEELMERHGFLNTNLLTLTGLVELSELTQTELEGHMLSKKIGMRSYYE